MKQDLKHYRELVAELNDITDKLSSYQRQDSVQSAAKHPYSVHSVPVHGLEPCEAVTLLLAAKQALERRVMAVEAFVDRIPQHRLRKAVRIYYINDNGAEVDGKRISWESTARLVRYSYGGDALRMAVNRAIKDLEK